MQVNFSGHRPVTLQKADLKAKMTQATAKTANINPRVAQTFERDKARRESVEDRVREIRDALFAQNEVLTEIVNLLSTPQRTTD